MVRMMEKDGGGVRLTLKASLAPSLAPVGHPISLASFSERRRDCKTLFHQSFFISKMHLSCVLSVIF